LKYKVQNNVFIVEKLKEVQNIFAMRFSMAHDKGNVFAVRLTLTHGKGDEQPNGVNVHYEKKCLPCATKKTHGKLFICRAKIKTHGKLFFYRAFFYRAPWKMRTTKLLFAVHPKICARQRSKRTAIIIFPVVAGGD
jgi:hypothetical protein